MEVVSTVANVGELSPWCLAKLGEALPEGTYRLAEGDPGPAVLGWLLGQHRFDRYKSKNEDERGPARPADRAKRREIDQTVRLAEATALVRDLVNTPAGRPRPGRAGGGRPRPRQGNSAPRSRSRRAMRSSQGYPMIAAVGQGATRGARAAADRARLGQGERIRRIAIVGKGVCFDSGGLDIKTGQRHAADEEGHGRRRPRARPGPADHGRAAAGPAPPADPGGRECGLRRPPSAPATSSTSRKGLKVEIDNTDAEGRLILGDALARAGEEEPELILDFATLTGAARVALGPDLPALFANDDELAGGLLERAAKEVADPMWRMPLWDGYDEMLKSRRRRSRQCGGFADGRRGDRRPVPARFVPEGHRPGPISTPSPGGRRPSRGGPRAATRWACAPPSPCFRSATALIGALSAANRPRFFATLADRYATNPPLARFTLRLRDDEEISNQWAMLRCRAGCAR